jgi:hypothetical protein
MIPDTQKTPDSRGGDGLFDMLQDMQDLAKKLLEEKEFNAAFFFAHAVGG